MPNWKKLLSSGSSGSLSNLVVDNHISASLISGSFYGDGSGLTGVIADGTISGSSQVNITQTEGYSTFSSSIQTYTDAKTAALSSSVDTHLDANISSLSSSAHTQREAIKGLATTANNSLSSSIATALRAEYVAADTALSSSQKTYIDQKVAGVVDSAPATLDTLNELAAALNDDPNFSASIATSIGSRVLTSTFNTYSGSAAGALRTEYKAGDSALSASAHSQRVAIASSIPTNNNQLTNGAGYITSFDITTQTDSKYLRSDTSDTMAGVLTLNSTNDNQLVLSSGNTWTGIGFDDGDAAAVDYLWHYGATGTFALGGGGSTTSGKKLHVDGGVSIGANADSVTMPTNGLYVEGELQLGSSFKAGTSVSAGYYQDSTNGAYRAITTSGDVGYYFQTNAGGSTKMYVGLHGTYAGKVGINSQTPGAVLDVNGSTAGETVFEVNGTNGTLFSVDDSLTGDLFTVADSSAVPIFSVNANGVVSVSGDLQVTGDVTAYYSSDERLKKNISPIDSPLEKLKLISGNTFEWDEENTAHNNKGKDIGVIAQEVEKVLPEIVGERKGYKAVQYEKIVALLIESNKALLSRVEELEAKIK